jgi:hypothetical protein
MAGGIDAEFGSSGTPAGVRIAPHEVRGCRFARPPATFWQPFRLRQGYGGPAGLRNGLQGNHFQQLFLKRRGGRRGRTKAGSF